MAAASPTASAGSFAPSYDGHAVRFLGASPATAGLVGRIDAEMAGAVDAVTAFWGNDWTSDIVVVATRSDAEFAAAAGDSTRDWSGVAAVAVADHADPAAREATGQRIVFAPGADAMADAALRLVLRHELFHLAARADTAGDAPRLLTEGVADFVARPATPVPRGILAVLPSDTDLDSPGPGRSAAYDRAWWFARFVADTHGRQGLRLLYERACGRDRDPLPEAVDTALGTDMADLLTDWQHWLAT